MPFLLLLIRGARVPQFGCFLEKVRRGVGGHFQAKNFIAVYSQNLKSIWTMIFSQNGECVTMEKPVPCTKTMIKMSNEEFVQRMSVSVMNDICSIFKRNHLLQILEIWYWLVLNPGNIILTCFKSWKYHIDSQGDWGKGFPE